MTVIPIELMLEKPCLQGQPVTRQINNLQINNAMGGIISFMQYSENFELSFVKRVIV